MPCFVNGMRLNSHPHVDKDGFLSAYYWRDGGLWGCKVSEKEKLIKVDIYGAI